MPPAFDSTPRAAFGGGHASGRRATDGRIGAVVEIPPDDAHRLPVELISAVYRASRNALMVLVCHRASRAAIDAALTPTVQEVGLDVHGVLYLDGEDEGAVREAVYRAPVVVASTERFRTRLYAWGVPFIDPREAVRHFDCRAERDLAA
ncbi:MAG TPA: hypothetical protein VF212_16490 [Longimicrobiales bacterium]